MPRFNRPFPDDSDFAPTPSADALEARLSVVLERDGVTISVAPSPRRSATRGAIALVTQDLQPSQPTERLSRAVDVTLAEEAQFAHRRHIPHVIGIRHEEHTPSAYIVRLEGEIGRRQIEHREGFGPTIHAWQAPSQAVPSMELICAQASDLWIEALDPVYFHDQFTPGEADQAFYEQYHWWSHLRSPFIRWQHHGALNGVNESPIVEEENSFEEEPVMRTLEMTELPEEQELPEISVMPEFVEEEQAERQITAESPEPGESAWSTPYLQPRLQIHRVMIGFFALFLIVLLPAGAVSVARFVQKSVQRIQGTTQQALASAQGALALTGSSQQQAFRQAAEGFREASASLTQLNALALGTAHALPQTRATVRVAEQLLQAGEEATQAAKLLSEGWDRLFAGDVTYPDERLQRLLTYTNQARPHLDLALSALASVDATVVPQQYRDKITEMQALIRTHQETLAQGEALMVQLLPIMGHEQPRTYLLVFQNSAELRPSGGFMGSIAEVVVDRGKITRIRVPGGGPYDLRSQLTARVAAPAPLQLVGARWEFQDANWFADFPKTAEKLRWFWSKANQPTLDGIMAVNSTVLPKLLNITGPITISSMQKTVSAENVLDELQKAVEVDYDKQENKPKKVIGELMSPLLQKLMDSSHDQWTQVGEVLARSLETKEIQVTLFHPEEQAAMDAFHWSGRWPEAFGDTLAVVGANIAGQKSDAVIHETVDQAVNIDEQGFITDTVTLTRVHQGQKGTQFNGVNNVQYVRVYVPQGATLLSASGFLAPSSSLFEVPTEHEPLDETAVSSTSQIVSPTETVDVSEENGRTVFGGWIQLKPGQRSVTQFQYRLPFTTFDLSRQLATVSGMTTDQTSSDKAYIAQRLSQSGKERDWHVTIQIPPSWTVRRSPPQTLTQGGHITESTEAFNQDQTRVVLFSSSHASSSPTPER